MTRLCDHNHADGRVCTRAWFTRYRIWALDAAFFEQRIAPRGGIASQTQPRSRHKSRTLFSPGRAAPINMKEDTTC